MLRHSLALLCLTTLIPAQSLDERIAASRLPFEWRESTPSAAGAEFLLREAARAEFTVIGESHGNVETCTLTGWLLDELRAHGYRSFATETGPCTTDHLVGVARADGAAGVVGFVRSYPFAVAFLFWQEEAQLFADAVAGDYGVWGLDQEFTGSPGFLLSHLAANAASEDARALASDWSAREQDALAHFMATRDPSKGFMARADAEAWRALDAAFADEDAALRRMLAELRASQEIYGHYHGGRYYENNRSRIALMKRHFADRLAAEPGKVLLKFGAAHAGRGYSPFDQLDIGNHAAEAAVARGGDSFHVFVFGKKSVAADGAERDLIDPASPTARLLAALPEDGADSVIDLRALRPALSNKTARREQAELHALVFRFDALVLLAELRASTPLIPLPAGG